MPKRVKKASQDPNKRAHQLLNEHLGKLASGKWAGEATDPAPPQGDPFKAQLSAYMSKLGKKGGDASGRNRMTSLTPGQRREIAANAARARWKKRKLSPKKRSKSGGQDRNA